MVWTVRAAFYKFRKNLVDLDPNITKDARDSRDYLFRQIKKLAREYSGFPEIESYPFIGFGSFARKTKIRPLDDIDFLVVLKGDDLAFDRKYSEPYTFCLYLPRRSTLSPQSSWQKFADDNGLINSTKVLNKIKFALSGVSNYQKAEIKKTMQAVTLKLKSYEWNYDIVPAIPIYQNYKLLYFLIPNGRGDWIATNPKIDADNTTDINLQHNGHFLPTLRLLKYWNGRIHKPKLSSYYFETLAIKVFQYRQSITNLPHAVGRFFDLCPIYLRKTCPDPKNLGPNLDANLDWSEKEKVCKAMKNAASYASEALQQEALSNYEDAIYYWQKVFGSNFPTYG